MARCVEEYAPTTGPLRVVDLGSRRPKRQRLTHRELFNRDGCEYLGVDVVGGPNVDLVMTKPYRVPLRSNSIDLVVSGQTFEHVPYFWVSMLEIARVLRPEGHAMIVVPSRGHIHGGQDFWRFYPDSMRALASWSGLELRAVSTDLPPRVPGTQQLDYSAIDPDQYWGDTVGVFHKPKDYPRLRTATVRPFLRAWANHRRRIEADPRPTTASTTHSNSSR
jgi:SAM-dependent methyltransferase